MFCKGDIIATRKQNAADDRETVDTCEGQGHPEGQNPAFGTDELPARRVIPLRFAPDGSQWAAGQALQREDISEAYIPGFVMLIAV